MAENKIDMSIGLGMEYAPSGAAAANADIEKLKQSASTVPSPGGSPATTSQGGGGDSAGAAAESELATARQEVAEATETAAMAEGELSQIRTESATARFAHRRAAAHKQALQDAEITNSASTLEQPEQEPPLNDGELAALRALGAELNSAQIAADAEYMTREMLAGLREGAEEGDELENRDYKRSSDGRFASTGAGQNNPRHKRASSGNPRAKRNKTNIPANLPPNATDGELERRLRKDMDNASAHKGNQITKRGNETYSTTQKRMDHSKKHVDEYKRTHPESAGKLDQSKVNARGAKIQAQADFDKDGDDAIAYDNNI